MRNWLVKLREERGMSQYAVAEAAGISQSYYASIETEARGHKLPQPTALKIANAIGFDWTLFYSVAYKRD